MTYYLRLAILGLFFSTRLLYAQSERHIIKTYEQGYAAYQQGNYEEALSHYEFALKQARKEQFHQGIAVNLIGSGFVYGLLGQHEKAFGRLEEALQLARNLKQPHEVAVCLHSLGAVYFFSSQYNKALEHFEAALQVQQGFTKPRDMAAVMNSLGIAYGSLGDYDKALEYFAEGLQLHQKQPNADDVAAILLNTATVYTFQQRYEDAERTIREADKVQQKTRTPWRSKVVLAEVYLATQRYAEALALLQENTPPWQESDYYRLHFDIQHGLALKGLGRLPEATATLHKAVSLAEEMRQRLADRFAFFGVSSRGGPIRAYRAFVATLAERALRGDANDTTLAPYGQSMAAAALYFAEATKARVLLETMAAAARQTTKVALPLDIREEEANLQAQLFAIQDQWSEAYKRGEKALNALREKKQKLLHDRHLLIDRLRKSHPTYAALHYPQPTPPESLPLQDHEVLLEYALGEEASYLFRVSRGRVDKVWRIPVSKSELERQVQAFLLPLQQPAGTGIAAFSPTLGHSLYTLLLAEALQSLKAGTQLLIVPDGILGLLPFETLVTSPTQDVKSTRFVGDTWQLRYYQSAAVLAFLRALPASTAQRALFALGHPIYDKQDPRYAAQQQGTPLPALATRDLSVYAYRGLGLPHEQKQATRSDYRGGPLTFPPLPETEGEVKTIAQLFGTAPQPPDVLLHGRANETQLRQTPLTRYRYLHFATHADLPGKLQGINEPFLLLGQVDNATRDDGLLTLSEVLNMAFDAEMVVLSACMTGYGSALEGEGVVNFARAFHQAGARSVVVSLWEVASEETGEYMKRFYHHLRAGKSKTEALALSRKEMRALYPHPFFWAPFILHGEG